MSILTIDAGNTRIKWGMFDDAGSLLKQGACLHAELSLKQLPQADKVMISNVAGSAVELQLNKLLENYPLIQWLTSKASACGVTNSYTIPGKLGTDRWAALIAAWHQQKSACVVVNAGTAVTIDALDNNGRFLGGMILPGLDLMQQSLYLATAQLPIQQLLPAKAIDLFATNTEDAIFSGALQAICGAISQAASTLQLANGSAPTILLSGGNAQIIHECLSLASRVTKPVVIVDNLVLQGLFLLATK